MEKIAAKFGELKELLKMVSGANRGKKQYDLLVGFIDSEKDGGLEANFPNHFNWQEQLENGIIEPIYEIYQVTIRKVLTERIEKIINRHNLIDNDKISPLIAIYSQFSHRRISIYPAPYDDFIRKSLLKHMQHANKTTVFNQLDNQLSKSEMTQVYYAIKHLKTTDELPYIKLPYIFSRPSDFKEEKRETLFTEISGIIRNNIETAGEIKGSVTLEHEIKSNSYLKALKETEEYNKLSPLEFIDFALSSLLTNHNFIYVFDLSFSQEIFAHRSLVLLVKEAEKLNEEKMPKWRSLVYEIDHILSHVLAFESNLKTYDMFLRSSDFVLKKDNINWSRINDQIKFRQAVLGDLTVKNKMPEAEPQNTLDFKFQHVRDIDIAESHKILDSLASLLPEIQGFLTAADYSAYRMPKYFSKSFRNLLLKEGVFEPKMASTIYSNILEEVKRCLYDFKLTNHEISVKDYLPKRCLGKYKDRLKESKWNVALMLDQFDSKNEKKDAKDDKKNIEKLFNDKTSLKYLERILTNTTKTIKVNYHIEVNEFICDYYGNRNGYDLNFLKQVENIQTSRSLELEIKKLLPHELESSLKDYKLIKPSQKEIRLIHGDLHFDNILVDPFDLYNPIDKLIDPGDFFKEGGDVAYDIGKLMHSFNGFYDFIHEGLFKLTFDEISDDTLECNFHIIANDYTFKNPIGTGGSGAEVNQYSPLYGGEIINYLYIRHENKKIIEKIFNDKSEDKDPFNCEKLIVRSEFNEALHFLTMIPFHVKENPTRALAIFMTGLILMKIWLQNQKLC